MNTRTDIDAQDPLGLARLPLLSPDRDAWPAIRQALEAETAPARGRRRGLVGTLAAAASVLLVVGLVRFDMEATDTDAQVAEPLAQTQTLAEPLLVPESGSLPELIALSQQLETRVRGLRENTGGIPARSAVYTAELEDMIARVDGEISMDPQAVNLWAQRVNLLLDLHYIYQHQFDREFGRMAGL